MITNTGSSINNNHNTDLQSINQLSKAMSVEKAATGSFSTIVKKHHMIVWCFRWEIIIQITDTINHYSDCSFCSWVRRSVRASPNDRRYSGLTVSSRAYIVSKYRDISSSTIVSNWCPTIWNRQCQTSYSQDFFVLSLLQMINQKF